MSAVKRCTHTLYTETAANISESHGSEMLQNQNIYQYDHTDSNLVRVRCSRTYRTDAQLPFHVLSGSEVRSDLPSYLQSEATEPVRSCQTISTIQSLPCSKFFATTRLDGQTRSEPSIFSRGHHQLLQMTCLPFGLSSAPRTFASITNWVAEFLRSHNIRCVVYLDDFLLVNQSKSQLEDDIAFTIKILHILGWTINFEKSVLAPTQCLEFLGITWDTKRNAKSLSEPKCLSLRNALHQQLQRSKWSLKQYQTLMGRLNFATFVTPRGRLHCRTLQYYSRQLSVKHPYRLIPIPQPARSGMEWWCQAIGKSMPIHLSSVTHLLTTDASDIGWGAQVSDTNIVGTWTNSQWTWHANKKEMFAVYAAIRQNQQQLQNAQILLQTDNRTVVSYINKEGGTKSKKLLQQTRKLLAVLDKQNIYLTAHYFPGRFNVEVDALSRLKACPEWHLTRTATTQIFRMWGTPEIDLFASRTAHIVPRYASLDVNDQEAQNHNAFCHQWHYDLAWLFPPPNLIPRVLRHLNQASGDYILIAPKWNKVFWQADVQRRARHPPFLIPDLARTLIDTRTGTHPPQVHDLHLEAWLISGGQIF